MLATATSVSGGTLKYSISVIGIKLLSQTLDVCTGLGVTCPVAAGEQTFTLTQKIPSDVPSYVSCRRGFPTVLRAHWLMRAPPGSLSLDSGALWHSGTYTLDATATTTDGEQITCFSASLDL